MKPWFSSTGLHTPFRVVHDFNLSSWNVETERTEIQDYPWFYKGCDTVMDYVRPCLKDGDRATNQSLADDTLLWNLFAWPLQHQFRADWLRADPGLHLIPVRSSKWHVYIQTFTSFPKGEIVDNWLCCLISPAALSLKSEFVEHKSPERRC